MCIIPCQYVTLDVNPHDNTDIQQIVSQYGIWITSCFGNYHPSKCTTYKLDCMACMVMHVQFGTLPCIIKGITNDMCFLWLHIN